MVESNRKSSIVDSIIDPRWTQPFPPDRELIEAAVRAEERIRSVFPDDDWPSDIQKTHTTLRLRLFDLYHTSDAITMLEREADIRELIQAIHQMCDDICMLSRRGPQNEIGDKPVEWTSGRVERKGRYCRIEVGSIDLIEEIRRVTIDACNFNSDDWCEYDANVLKRAANMIRREIAEKTAEPFPSTTKSTPIAPTPVLEGRDAEEFIRKVKENENKPSYPCADPEKLEEARKMFIEEQTKRKKHINCPSCRGSINIYDEWTRWHDYKPYFETECPHCKSFFDVDVSINPTFTCYEKKKRENKP